MNKALSSNGAKAAEPDQNIRSGSLPAGADNADMDGRTSQAASHNLNNPIPGSMEATGTAAALEDTYIKVLANGTTPAATASGGGSVAIGSGALARSGSNSANIAIGSSAKADTASGGLGGYGTMAIGVNAIAGTSGYAGGGAIGFGAQSNAANYAIGDGAKALAGANSFSLAIGSSSSASGLHATAIGASASATATRAVALGANSVAETENTVSVGSATLWRRITNVNNGTAETDAVNLRQLVSTVSPKVDDARVKVGGTVNATVSGRASNIAIGSDAQSTGAASNSATIALGESTRATGDAGSIALGTNAEATAQSAIAIGLRTHAYAQNSTAIGPTSSATASNAVALGYGSSADRENTVSVGSATQQRQIVNVADATTATDAVNLRQLNAVDARVTALNTTVDGISVQVTKNTQDITQIRTDLTGGTIGLVQQSSPGADLTVGKATDGAAVNFTSTDGDRKLTGVTEGEVSTASNDAVNGKQLYATNVNVNNLSTRVDGVDARVTNNETAVTNIRNDLVSGELGLVQQNPVTNTITVAEASGGTLVNVAGTEGTRRVTGLSEGEVSGSSNDAVTGKQLNATNVTVKNLSNNMEGLNTRVTNNETAVTNIRNELGSGSVGLVQQNPITHAITVAEASGGTSANFAGTDGARKLMGVAEGEVSSASNDAVNGKQLNTTNVSVKNLSTRVDSVDARVTNNETAVTNIRNDLVSGELGLVKQNPTTNAITVAAGSAGTSASFAGTEGARRLMGVDEGELSSASTHAVNGSQLHATNEAVAENTAAITHLNTGVAELDGRVANVGGKVTTIDGKVSELEAGTTGLVQQAGVGANLTVGAATNGAAVDFKGTTGERRLTGIANGTQDNDAATWGQTKAALSAKADSQFIAVRGNNTGATAYPYSIALGGRAVAGAEGTNESSVAVGYEAQAPVGGAIAIGRRTIATGPETTAIGSGATASAAQTLAIGRLATASAQSSMAIGYESVADRPDTLSVGSTAKLRQIVNVANGEQLTDAVTVGQVREALLAESARVIAELRAESERAIAESRAELERSIAALRAEIHELRIRLNAS